MSAEISSLINKFFAVLSAIIIAVTGSAGLTISGGGEESTKLTQTQVVNGDFSSDPTLLKLLNNSKNQFIIPGLEQGFVPQGLFYDDAHGVYLISGYYRDKSLPSRIVVVDKDGNFVKSVGGMNKSGSKAFGHFGGVAAYKDFVYIATTTVTHVFSFDDIMNAEDDGYVTIKDELYTDVTCSYVNVCGDTLYIGEYIDPFPSKKAAAKRKATSKTGEKFYARCNAYSLSPNAESGVERIDGKGNITPDYSLATPIQAQGMTRLRDGKIVISSSATNVTCSHLYVYKDVTKNECDFVDTVNSSDVPVYLCTREQRIATHNTPALSEEVTLMPDGSICLISESAAMYYRRMNKTPTDHVLNIDIEKMNGNGLSISDIC